MGLATAKTAEVAKTEARIDRMCILSVPGSGSICLELFGVIRGERRSLGQQERQVKEQMWSDTYTFSCSIRFQNKWLNITRRGPKDKGKYRTNASGSRDIQRLLYNVRAECSCPSCIGGVKQIDRSSITSVDPDGRRIHEIAQASLRPQQSFPPSTNDTSQDKDFGSYPGSSVSRERAKI